MITPTKEQVIQWAWQAHKTAWPGCDISLKEMEGCKSDGTVTYHETFSTLARADLEAENTALKAEIARLQSLSVTSILVDVVPGWDGGGEEVYAKSVDDVEHLLTRLSEKAEDYDIVTIPLRLRLDTATARIAELEKKIAQPS